MFIHYVGYTSAFSFPFIFVQWKFNGFIFPYSSDILTIIREIPEASKVRERVGDSPIRMNCCNIWLPVSQWLGFLLGEYALITSFLQIILQLRTGVKEYPATFLYKTVLIFTTIRKFHFLSVWIHLNLAQKRICVGIKYILKPIICLSSQKWIASVESRKLIASLIYIVKTILVEKEGVHLICCTLG